ncbi:hypothetical protein ACLB2K_012063 [Fragaria x ananassa]
MGTPKADGGMGFRDIHHFNLALLAKQCWRLIQNPNSLWAKCLKGQYFPKCSFMEAKKGYRASWGWSNLIEARDCFMGEGCFWQVSNGNDINIWKDKWLPPPNAAKVRVIGDIPANDPSSVGSFIDWDLRGWNTTAIDHVIHPQDIQRIVDIPIGDGEVLDCFLWPWNKIGVYTVRSGYHWYHTSMSIPRAPSIGSSHQFDPKIWKILWSIKTLPKVRNFSWRVLHGQLQLCTAYTRERSFRTLCVLCGKTEETFEHLLLLCHWVDPIWFGSPLGIRIDKRKITTFDRWLISICNHCPSSEREAVLTLISTICWAIWKERCHFVYQHREVSPPSTIRAARNLALEFRHASASMRNSRVPRLHMQWLPPPFGHHKINSDASWFPPDHTGVGIVIRDSNRVMIAGSSLLKKCGSVTDAEAAALLVGSELVASLQLQNIIFESDLEEVITEINKNHNKVNWRTHLIIQQIRRSCSMFNSCSWVWIPREANRVAHVAASLAFRSVDPL